MGSGAKSARSLWLDRRIAAPGPYLALCTTEDQFAAACRHIKCVAPVPWVKTDHADATTHHFNGPRGLASIVCIRVGGDRTPIEIAGLLVHEAVHVWQEYASYIGETNPGAEQEAYAVQSIAQELMSAYAKSVE